MAHRNNDTEKEILEALLQFVLSGIVVPIIAILLMVGSIVIFIAGFVLFLSILTM